MKGFELFDFVTSKKYTSEKDREYSQLLYTLFINFKEDLFPLLEKAEKENKRLFLKENKTDNLIDSYLIEDVILI